MNHKALPPKALQSSKAIYLRVIRSFRKNELTARLTAKTPSDDSQRLSQQKRQMYQLKDASGTCTLMEPDVAFLKHEVAKMLRVHHNTITSWDTIAFFRIPHYRKCYEVQPGKYNRRMPLAKYQVWVLQRIQKLFKRLKNADRVRQYLTAYPQEFTFQAFQQEK